VTSAKYVIDFSVSGQCVRRIGSRTVGMAGPGKPGRRSKGPWKKVSAKIPSELITKADEEAERRGLDRTAIFVEALAARFGVPVPIQEALPLSDAA